MKDFKTMPKMACGGGLKKYNAGSSVKFDRDPVSKKVEFDGEQVDVKPAAMPGRFGMPKPKSSPVYMPGNLGGSKKTVNIPGIGEVNRSDIEARKKGGKVKRGNKK